MQRQVFFFTCARTAERRRETVFSTQDYALQRSVHERLIHTCQRDISTPRAKRKVFCNPDTVHTKRVCFSFSPTRAKQSVKNARACASNTQLHYTRLTVLLPNRHTHSHTDLGNSENFANVPFTFTPLHIPNPSRCCHPPRCTRDPRQTDAKEDAHARPS